MSKETESGTTHRGATRRSGRWASLRVAAVVGSLRDESTTRVATAHALAAAEVAGANSSRSNEEPPTDPETEVTCD